MVTLDDKVAGIAGLARRGGTTWLFTDHKPGLVPYLSSVTVWRAIKRALQFVDESPCTVWVFSSDSAMMTKLGFVEVSDCVWRT